MQTFSYMAHVLPVSYSDVLKNRLCLTQKNLHWYLSCSCMKFLWICPGFSTMFAKTLPKSLSVPNGTRFPIVISACLVLQLNDLPRWTIPGNQPAWGGNLILSRACFQTLKGVWQLYSVQSFFFKGAILYNKIYVSFVWCDHIVTLNSSKARQCAHLLLHTVVSQFLNKESKSY